jgi:hypothetical protein
LISKPKGQKQKQIHNNLLGHKFFMKYDDASLPALAHSRIMMIISFVKNGMISNVNLFCWFIQWSIHSSLWSVCLCPCKTFIFFEKWIFEHALAMKRGRSICYCIALFITRSWPPPPSGSFSSWNLCFKKILSAFGSCLSVFLFSLAADLTNPSRC